MFLLVNDIIHTQYLADENDELHLKNISFAYVPQKHELVGYLLVKIAGQLIKGRYVF